MAEYANTDLLYGYGEDEAECAHWKFALANPNSIESRMVLLATRKPRKAKNVDASRLVRLLAEDMI